jgi:hypothetical protein
MKLQKSQITIDNLLEALARGRDAIKEASAIMVGLVDQDSRIYEKIIKQQPGLSLNLLATLEKVGRGVIYDALLFDSSPGARRLLTLPFSQQREYYEKPVKIVSIQGTKTIVTEKPIQQCTPKEIRTAFKDNGMRSVEEQCEAIKSESVALRSRPAQRYEILDNGDVIVFYAQTRFTAAQFEDIYERAKTKSIKSLAREVAK